ncbi:hypothetical protein [Streptomyces sp. NPDC056785]|uniref:hypothetical protein n=1 Tax=Streptomyces sp. NPDC056785 TaxID=3345944 RepID=UPI003686B338
MGSWKLTLCAGAVTAAALTPTAYAAVLAPAAYAAVAAARSDATAVSVTPAAPAPGSDIRLRAEGCTGSTGTAASTAFVSDARLTGSGGVLTGETRVRTSLSPGTYDVTVGCEGGQGLRQVTGTVTVAGQAEPLSTLSAPASLPASPVAPVHAGGGGTADADGSGGPAVAVDARATGPGARQAVIGLVLAGVAAVAVALRSARRGRDSSE